MDKRIMVLLVVLSVFLYGCSQGGNNSSSESTPFLGGTQGVSAKFELGAPPDEFYDASSGSAYPFDINLMINNVGEEDIEVDNFHMKIMGLLLEDFGKTSEDFSLTNEEILEATEKDTDGNIIEGTELDIGVTGLEYGGELTGNIQFPIRAEMCYKYRTVANAQLCYKSDLTDISDTKICTPRESKVVYNSGAPVHVTSLEQNVIGTDRISMTVTIKKVGNGRIFKEGFDGAESGYTCAWEMPDDISERDLIDRVTVTVDTGVDGTLECPSLTDVTCTGSSCTGEAKLYNNQRVIRCNQDITTTIDYEKVANIYLDYNFEQSIEKTILGKHGI